MKPILRPTPLRLLVFSIGLITIPHRAIATEGQPAAVVHAKEETKTGRAITTPSQPFLFKIGFEFQEAHNLLKGASEYFDIQKKPVFEVMWQGRKLWHVEVDGNDIEFVTAPFPDSDVATITLCINSIMFACNALQKLVLDKKEKTRKEDSKVTFREWIDGAVILLDDSEMTSIKKAIANLQSQPLSDLTTKNIQSLEQKLQETYLPGLLQQLQGKGFTVNINNSPSTGVLFNWKINATPTWRPKFVPQVTIQHPLEYSIPLVLHLFGIKNNTNPIQQALLPALPSIESISKSGKIPSDYFSSKENGLLFLHALTCSSIQRVSGFMESLYQIKYNFETYGQVDPKINMHFLSRRPFSKMWSDIKEKEGKKITTFVDLYKEKILEGNAIFSKDVAANFRFVNYAEEYYNNGARWDFTELRTLLSQGVTPAARNPSLDDASGQLLDFNDSFGSMAEDVAVGLPSGLEDPLAFLLGKGIISTGMIRQHFEPRIFDDYINVAIKSVDGFPHYSFDPMDKNVKRRSTIDVLSPPWLLESDNSMGAYVNIKDFDTRYGEAILEMRSIKDISGETLEAMGFAKERRRGTFLTAEAKEEDIFAKGVLIADVISLLNFIKGLDISQKFGHVMKNITEKYKQELENLQQTHR